VIVFVQALKSTEATETTRKACGIGIVGQIFTGKFHLQQASQHYRTTFASMRNVTLNKSYSVMVS